MICTPKFIEIYNETFKFIDEHGVDVKEYWKLISPIVLSDLKEMVEKQGLFGALDYWDKVLTAEKAEFDILITPKCFLELEITDCPSLSHLENPYKNYCGHCDVMYRQLFESLGYEYKIEKTGVGSCHITVSK